MKIKHFSCIVFLCFLLLSCKKQDQDIKPQGSISTPQRALDVSNAACNGAQWKDSNYAGNSDVRNNFSIRYFNNTTCGRTPLIIAIHGGGFYSGNKDLMIPANLNAATNLNDFPTLLTEDQLSNQRIAYATINYRYVKANSDHLAIPLSDCKAFLAYIRSHADEYNVDPNRIILMGFSAGASSALWVGLQDPSIKGIIAFSPQATLNVARWQPDIFQPYGWDRTQDIINFFFTGNPPLAQFYYGSTNLNLIQQYSNQNKLDMRSLMDSSDPELYLANGMDDLLHNAPHVYALKQKAQSVGLPARIAFMRNPYFLNPEAETIMQFCIRKFGL